MQNAIYIANKLGIQSSILELLKKKELLKTRGGSYKKSSSLKKPKKQVNKSKYIATEERHNKRIIYMKNGKKYKKKNGEFIKFII